MQVDHLNYFVDVAHLGSVTKVAKKRFITPQGVSRAISTLESEFGVKLFNRSRNSLELTSEGIVLLSYAEQISESALGMQSALRQMKTRSAAHGGRELDFYCAAIVFETPFYYPVMKSMSGIQMDVKMHQMDNADVVSTLVALDSEETDRAAGVLNLFDALDDENDVYLEMLEQAGYSIYPLLTTPDLALVAAESELAMKDRLARLDMLDYPLVVSTSDMARCVERVFGPESIFLRTAASSFRIRLAANGEAITFVPGITTLMGLDEDTRAVPFENAWNITVVFACRPSLFDDYMFKAAFDQLHSFYRSHERSGLVTMRA